MNILVVVVKESGEEIQRFRESIDPTKTVGNLKRQLAARIPETIKTLQVNGYDLRDVQTISSIPGGSEIRVILESVDMEILNLHVQMNSVNPNIPSANIKCSKHATTDDLIAKIHSKYPFDVSSAYLTIRGQQLRSGSTLVSQNVRNNDQICVCMRVRGG